MIDYELSHFDASMDAYRNSRRIVESHKNGEENISTAKTELAKLDLNIGKIYLKSDYSKAAPCFERAYHTFLTEKGPSDVLTLNALGHKAVLLAHSGNYEEAEKLYLDIYNQMEAKSSDRGWINYFRIGMMKQFMDELGQ